MYGVVWVPSTSRGVKWNQFASPHLAGSSISVLAFLCALPVWEGEVSLIGSRTN